MTQMLKPQKSIDNLAEKMTIERAKMADLFTQYDATLSDNNISGDNARIVIHALMRKVSRKLGKYYQEILEHGIIQDELNQWNNDDD